MKSQAQIAVRMTDESTNVLSSERALPLAYALQHDGVTLMENLSLTQAQNAREAYKNFFGGVYDIIETKTLGTNGKEIFVGTPEKFSHNPSHIPSNVPMFDICINGKVVERNLTLAQADGYIRVMVAEDMKLAGVKDISSAVDDVMRTLTKQDMSDIYNISLTCIMPAENNSPAPTPGKTETGGPWRKVRKVGSEKKTVVKELTYQATPKEYWQWSVLDVANNKVLYNGTRESCLAYMSERMRAGFKLHTMRVKRYSKIAGYVANVLLHGWRLISHGETVCIGTRAEVQEFLIAGLKEGWLSEKTCRVERI